MPGLVPGIHELAVPPEKKTWMAGTSPAMTERVDAANATRRQQDSQQPPPDPSPPRAARVEGQEKRDA